MGTWGSGSFENDDASDFLLEFQNDGIAALWRVFEITNAEYLEAPEAQRAVAGAEIVALVSDPERHDETISPAFPETIARLAPLLKPHLTELRVAAVLALNRVLADKSELKELWEEGDPSEWTNAIGKLKDSLAN